MNIILSPQRREEALEIFKKGEVLTINGEDYDFSPMSEGDTLPADATTCPWLVGNIEKQDGHLSVTVILPIPFNYSQEQAFPEPIMDAPDGLVELPLPLPVEEVVTEEVLSDE
jgi:hypothetical protein